ncbi:hypothetical protein [Paracoccus shanxieyensis]|uniref:Uncharacterized protein n=1 Tax=Paracoccus shanxieyensis TaxID=2675752 RepID=A0A6L6IW74_9RHOB|nr:hypothetical protein [Paracoccus shanxieyensis]MTH64756.1 hypothetical protein [Paracoccus shanxieyensis]MTH88011.1 hypothetical protein [Paracoccus shanxieyensis]
MDQDSEHEKNELDELRQRVAGLEDLVFTLSIWMKSYALSVAAEEPEDPRLVVQPFSLTAKQRAILRSVIPPDSIAQR